MKKTMVCPECERTLIYNGVMWQGNVLAGEAPRPVGRYDCPACLVIVTDPAIDEAEGWQQWAAQGNQRHSPIRSSAMRIRLPSPLKSAMMIKPSLTSTVPRIIG